MLLPLFKDDIVLYIYSHYLLNWIVNLLRVRPIICILPVFSYVLKSLASSYPNFNTNDEEEEGDKYEDRPSLPSYAAIGTRQSIFFLKKIILFSYICNVRIHFDIIMKAWDIIYSNSVPNIAVYLSNSW